MKIIIYRDTKDLVEKVKFSLDELWLNDFIEVEANDSDEIKDNLKITKEPALIISEESIDFYDTMFEWIIPSEDELKSMLISIIWWNSQWCDTDDCSTCSSWC